MWSPFVKRGTEVIKPPISLETSKDATRPSDPPTYSYTQRREPQVGPQFLASPDDQFYHDMDNTPVLPGVSLYQEAPDPVRQSRFWAERNKIRPWAHMPKVSKLNMASIIAQSNQAMTVGKLKQFRNVPMFEGTQLPSVQRYNIREGQATTFGSQYEVVGTNNPGPLILASGMAYTQSLDGHPY